MKIQSFLYTKSGVSCVVPSHSVYNEDFENLLILAKRFRDLIVELDCDNIIVFLDQFRFAFITSSVCDFHYHLVFNPYESN